jgi:hypothetical protein
VVHAQAPVATQPTVGALIKANPTAKINTFIEAAKAVNLYDKLTGTTFTGTVLIPNDDAFARLLAQINATKAELLADKDLLTMVLQYHISPTVVPSIAAFATLASLPTLLTGRLLQYVLIEVPGKANRPGIQSEVKQIKAALGAPNGIEGLVGSGSVRRWRWRWLCCSPLRCPRCTSPLRCAALRCDTSPSAPGTWCRLGAAPSKNSADAGRLLSVQPPTAAAQTITASVFTIEAVLVPNITVASNPPISNPPPKAKDAPPPPPSAAAARNSTTAVVASPTPTPNGAALGPLSAY